MLFVNLRTSCASSTKQNQAKKSPGILYAIFRQRFLWFLFRITISEAWLSIPCRLRMLLLLSFLLCCCQNQQKSLHKPMTPSTSCGDLPSFLEKSISSSNVYLIMKTIFIILASFVTLFPWVLTVQCFLAKILIEWCEIRCFSGDNQDNFFIRFL